MKKNVVILIFSVCLFVSVSTIIYFRKKLSFKNKLVRLANQELKRWQGLHESTSKGAQILVEYWRSVNRHFTKDELQQPSVQNKYPWSSAFISFLFKTVGARTNFPYSASHSTYFQYAKKNRNNSFASLRGFRITEYRPKVGDIIVYSRAKGKNYNSTGHFASHGELVSYIGKGYLLAIGGNVSNGVRQSKYTTNKGYITQKEAPFFMVIQNNIR